MERIGSMRPKGGANVCGKRDVHSRLSLRPLGRTSDSGCAALRPHARDRACDPRNVRSRLCTRVSAGDASGVVSHSSCVTLGIVLKMLEGKKGKVGWPWLAASHGGLLSCVHDGNSWPTL